MRREREVNEALKEIVDAKIAQFKKAVAQAEPSKIFASKSALYIDYALLSLNRRSARVKFIVSSYVAGDASPNNYSSVVKYDFKNRAVK